MTNFSRENLILDLIYDQNIPVIFDKKDTFIYLPIDKNCQTSIARSVLAGRSVVKKDNISYWQSYKDKRATDRIVFAIIREPMDRLVSTYLYFTRHGLVKESINDFIEKRIDTNSRKHEKELFKNFNVWDCHLNPQHVSIFSKGEVVPDLLIPMNNPKDFHENMNTLFALINEKDAKMVWKNKSYMSQKERVNVVESITRVNMKKFINFYRKDIEMWSEFGDKMRRFHNNV